MMMVIRRRAMLVMIVLRRRVVTKPHPYAKWVSNLEGLRVI